jgi:CO/xanthine dehydrogenase Mo-binding subunit
MIGWARKYPRREENGKIRAVGMAITMQGSGVAGIDTSGAVLKLNDSGAYVLLVGSADIGTGSDTILAQIAAEVLQVPAERIVVISGDTDTSPMTRAPTPPVPLT